MDAHTRSACGEGGTPLVPGEWHGAPVLYKLEFMMPTGSFKDRGMTVMVSYLKSRGIDRVLEDSSGNAGASLVRLCGGGGHAVPHPRAGDRVVSEDRPDRGVPVPTW